MKTLRVVTINKVEDHPNASKLKVCTINDENQDFTVVCGASNVRLGMKSVFAPVGSTTPKGVNIEKANLRGVDSFGMLCSAKDLSISDESGIVDLPDEISGGTLLKDIAVDYLSSIPWHSFKLIESLWEDSNGNIKISRDLGQSSPEGKLLSKTYYNDGKYCYRHFN